MIKKFNIIITAPMAKVVLLLFNGVPILQIMFGKENSRLTTLAGFVASTVLGTILKVAPLSGLSLPSLHYLYISIYENLIKQKYTKLRDIYGRGER